MRNNYMKVAIVILLVHLRIVASNNLVERITTDNPAQLLCQYVHHVLLQRASHQETLPYIEKVKYLIEQKADLNEKVILEWNSHEETLMSYCFKAFNEYSIVKFMIEHNGNIHIKNSDGNSPFKNLFVSSRNNALTNDLLHYLENIGVDFLEKISNGRPLFCYRINDVINVEDSNYFLQKYLKVDNNFEDFLMSFLHREEGHQSDKIKEAMDIFLKKGLNPFMKFHFSFTRLLPDYKSGCRYGVEHTRNSVVRDVFFNAMMDYSIEEKYKSTQFFKGRMSFITSLKLFQKKHRLIIPKVLQQYIINIYTQDISRDEQSLKKDYIQSKDKKLSKEFIQRLDDHALKNNIITFIEEK